MIIDPFLVAGPGGLPPVKTLDRLDVERYGEEVRIYAEARSFLHNQVRAMVGSLKWVGQGKWSDRDVKDALEACDRSRCGPNAPPHGLYLTGVAYDRVDDSAGV